MTYLRPDSKSQVTVQYAEDHHPERIDSIVVSTQHDEFADDDTMLATIRRDVQEILIPRVVKSLPDKVQKLFNTEYQLFVNPTGKFVIGGPHGDTGLTGRKIIVDTYGGRGAHGGGAFSGKDPSKVDRSAAYATRHIAKNLVAAGLCDQVLIQVAYAIGKAEPVGLYVNTYGTAKVNMPDSEIAKRVSEIFPMRPHDIINRFQLKNPIYEPTAAYGHFGRDCYEKTVNGRTITFFPWEKLDYVDAVKKAFEL